MSAVRGQTFGSKNEEKNEQRYILAIAEQRPRSMPQLHVLLRGASHMRQSKHLTSATDSGEKIILIDFFMSVAKPDYSDSLLEDFLSHGAGNTLVDQG